MIGSTNDGPLESLSALIVQLTGTIAPYLSETALSNTEYKPKLRVESPAKSTVTNTKHRFLFLQATQKIVLSIYMLQCSSKGGWL